MNADRSLRPVSNLLVAAGLVAAALALPAPAADIQFRTGAVLTADRPDEQVALDLADLAAPVKPRHLVVTLRRPLAADDRARLEANGLTLLRPLGGTSYFASVPAGFDGGERVAGLGLLGDVRPIEPAWKMHPFLLRGDVPTWAVVEPGRKPAGGDETAPRGPDNPTVALYVLFHPDVELVPDAWALVAGHGGRVRNDLVSLNGLVVEMPWLGVDALAAEDGVQYVEPALPKFRELNNSNRAITGADAAQGPPYGLDGSGVSVMVYDGGYALASHVDFQGRLTVRDSSTLSDHATHVSGTVGGAGIGNVLYKGMAPAVTIESYGFEQEGGLQQGFLYTDPGDLEDDYTEAINTFGVDISNNSIGTNTESNGFPCDWQGDYGVTSSLIDAVVRGSVSGGVPFRIVWAAGNERQGSSCDIEGHGDYYSTAPPAGAKNHLTVGALNSNDDTMTSFSSWGPTDDGRLKPDISAPGCQSDDDFDVTSCSSSGGYTGKCGTSMASPTVCGLSALLLQDFRLNNPTEPDFRNSTLKAVYANTAVDLGNVGPDYQFGHGSVRIVDAIELMRAGNWVEDQVGQGDTFSALITVNPGDPLLQVTLAWDDVPGTPNVSPSLVNDLDLEVYDGSGTRHFPWTLNPLDPGAPAVQTVADHLNNIEQVTIPAPPAGVYRVDIVGFNVPQGPQSFSLAATPTLINCSSRGVVSVDKVKYACAADAIVRVVDCDLNTDDGVVEQVVVTISSDSEPGGESLVLIESGPETAAFEASIPLSETDAVGTLHIADGDLVTASYVDADDGQGGTNVLVTDTAPVDCTDPVALAVAAIDVQPRSARIQINTDEPVQATVHYGTSCLSLGDSAGSAVFRTDHLISLSNLQDDTTYHYIVDLVDEAGNATTDDNGGACYSFTTPQVPDFFTEQFTGGLDLDGFALELVPNASVDEYRACIDPITALPTDPTGGTVLSLSDDGNQLIALGLGQAVTLYGTAYGSFYVGSNGYITFTAADGDWTESLADHFDLPRISVMFDDFNPSVGGAVSWMALGDRVAVTWQNVPEFSTSNSNTFQAELFFDGRIRLSWLGMASGDGIVGTLPGDVNGDGVVDVSDLLDVLAAWGPCPGCPEDTNGDGVVDVTDLLQVLADWTTTGSSLATAGGASAGGAIGDDAASLTDDGAGREEPDPGSTGRIVRTFINDGVVAPIDHGGVFELARPYRQLPEGVLRIEIAGPRPVEEHDLLVVQGRTELG
ncbi:MAG: S8 family serine peptidase, partial [Planctomycetota bacterium]